MRRLLYMVVFLLPVCSFAQRQNDVWYFGDGAGVTFASGTPTPIRGPISTQEGTASIADPVTGRVLFSTDGVRVFGRNLAVMPNGSGLEGGWSSTQSALIVPKPKAPGSYYLFTAGDLSNGDPTNPGLHYNVVDMAQNGGNGDVTLKNVRLLDSCAEKLHATPHCDGESYWVIAHHLTLPRFYMYKVTAAGIEPPVISDVGTQYVTDNVAVGGNYGLGMVKFSASGRFVALANPYARRCEVFDVNTFRGTISNPRLVDTAGKYYGLAFSPNEQLLYVTTWNEVYQYVLTSTAITPSRVLLGSIPTADIPKLVYRGGIQRGPDGRIYLADGAVLRCIPKPDLPGSACGYPGTTPVLLSSPSKTLIGLPNIVDGQYLTEPIPECKPPVARFACDSIACMPTCLPVVNYSSKNVRTWSWQFPTGTPSSFVGEVPPQVCFTAPGSIVMQLAVSNEYGTDTFRYPVRIGYLPEVTASPDLSFCSNSSKTLFASGAVRYEWTPASGVDNATSSNPKITADRSTTFIVRGWNADGCSTTDTVVAEYLDPEPLILNNVTCHVSDRAVYFVRHAPGDFDSCDITFSYSKASMSDVTVDVGEELTRGTGIDGRNFLRVRMRTSASDDIGARISGTAMLQPLLFDNILCTVDTSYGCRQVSSTTATLEASGCALDLRHIRLTDRTMLARTIYDMSGRIALRDDVRYDQWEEQPTMLQSTPSGLFIEVLMLEGTVVHKRTFLHVGR